MNWAVLSRRVYRLAVGLVVSMVGYWLVRQTDFDRAIAPDAEGLNALITLIGGIYAVVFAFVIFVIWGQFTEVENASTRECSSLNDLLRFSQYVHPDTNRAVRRALGEYTQRVANSEWHALGESRKDPAAEKAFAMLMQAVLRSAPAGPEEAVVLQRMVDIARKAGEQRDERVAKSLTRIPPTLLALVRTMAGALLLLVFIYPFHDWRLGALGFALVETILYFSNLVMTDTDNPFDGVFNVSPRAFTDLTL